MSEFLQHLVNMLVLGGTYALLGIGLTLIFGIMNVVNFTHGVLYTFGAYMMFIVVQQLGLNFFLALPVAVVAGWVLGAVIELTLLRPLRGSDIDTTMLVMIGAWIAMQSGALWIWGGVAKSVTTPFPEEPLVIGPGAHSTVPAMVSGNEIPIAPLPASGTLAMLTPAGEVRPLDEMEHEIIRFAISHYRGQMSEVARRLKIGRSTLYRKLDEASADDQPADGREE